MVSCSDSWNFEEFDEMTTEHCSESPTKRRRRDLEGFKRAERPLFLSEMLVSDEGIRTWIEKYKDNLVSLSAFVEAGHLEGGALGIWGWIAYVSKERTDRLGQGGRVGGRDQRTAVARSGTTGSRSGLAHPSSIFLCDARTLALVNFDRYETYHTAMLCVTNTEIEPITVGSLVIILRPKLDRSWCLSLDDGTRHRIPRVELTGAPFVPFLNAELRLRTSLSIGSIIGIRTLDWAGDVNVDGISLSWHVNSCSGLDCGRLHMSHGSMFEKVCPATQVFSTPRGAFSATMALSSMCGKERILVQGLPLLNWAFGHVSYRSHTHAFYAKFLESYDVQREIE